MSFGWRKWVLSTKMTITAIMLCYNFIIGVFNWQNKKLACNSMHFALIYLKYTH